ncbi:MAG TPA: OmpA family protein [Polyangia bacterium]|jgi:chemotaxis protein MotB
MKSQLDGEIPEYSLAPRRSSSSKAPWVVTLLSMLAAGGAVFFMLGQREKTSTVQRDLDDVRPRMVNAEARVKDLTAKLETAENERAALAAAKESLSKDVASKDEELTKLKATETQLQDKLKAELSSGDVSLTEDGGKLRVGLVDKVLFNSGESAINKRGETVLMKVGSILANVADRQILVSGHTDQTPIGEKRASQFPTNWELSTARATTVVRFLQEQAKVPGEHLVASGYGEYHPVASNKSSAGRAKNRRIEILLVPMIAPKAIGKAKLAERAQKKPK